MKRSMPEELEYYSKMNKTLKKKSDLTPAFLRPPYQHTVLENKTVEKYHENDWIKD